MGELMSAAAGWRRGGATMTLEQWRAQQVEPPKPPSRGTAIDAGTERAATIDWREHARCKIDNKPTSSFFPEAGDQTTSRIAAYCGKCDVQAECRAFAIAENLWIGWYGGESPKQRAHTAQKWSGPDRKHGTAARAQYGARGFDKSNACLCRPCADAWIDSLAKAVEQNRRKNRAARERQLAERESASQ